MFGHEALAFLAGVLSILSPCVLPLLPIVLGAAGARHPLGPLGLALGLALSFVAIGLFVASIGYGLGFDGAVVRRAGAVLLLGAGVMLLVPALQDRLSAFAGPVGNWAGQRLNRLQPGGPVGQFGLGLLLGAVWSPCVGPTLGAASVLAAQGRDLGQVALVMTAFGIGAALPLVLIGLASREAMMRWRRRLLGAGTGGKRLLGVMLGLLGVFILSGIDRSVETILVDLSPVWLTELTTRY